MTWLVRVRWVVAVGESAIAREISMCFCCTSGRGSDAYSVLPLPDQDCSNFHGDRPSYVEQGENVLWWSATVGSSPPSWGPHQEE